eukprot:GHVU01073832.1.p1 GENE.GHVU01073832.1~~GHVU01073832.1.p1  ORF type:complete len:105 (-),score=1.47 GHVU01073832.1:151-465(-)
MYELVRSSSLRRGSDYHPQLATLDGGVHPAVRSAVPSIGQSIINPQSTPLVSIHQKHTPALCLPGLSVCAPGSLFAPTPPNYSVSCSLLRLFGLSQRATIASSD